MFEHFLNDILVHKGIMYGIGENKYSFGPNSDGLFEHVAQYSVFAKKQKNLTEIWTAVSPVILLEKSSGTCSVLDD